MAVQKKKKKKLNVKRLILLLLILYLIVMLCYAIISMPIKNIYIKNTKLLKDNEIIEVSGIKNYPGIFKISSKKMEDKIRTLDLVSGVKVKKSIWGKVIITIEEAKPLFYNRTVEKVVLSNKKEVSSSSKYLGIPTLVNRVPSDLLETFIKSFCNIETDIIGMINEIEYNPDIAGDIVIDSNRFLLRMNDSNIVYVNTLNMKRLNDYKQVMGTIGDARGTLYLDSYNSNNSLFTQFENQDTDVDDDEKKDDENAGDSDNDGRED
jgi:cell division septal protein FtsQ